MNGTGEGREEGRKGKEEERRDMKGRERTPHLLHMSKYVHTSCEMILPCLAE